MPEVYIAVHSIGTKGGLKPPGSFLRVPEDLSEETAAALLAAGHIRKPKPEPEPKPPAAEPGLATAAVEVQEGGLVVSADSEPDPDPAEAAPPEQSPREDGPPQGEAQGEPAAETGDDYTPPPAEQEVVIVGRNGGGLPFDSAALNLETQDDLLPNHKLLLERDGVRVFIAATEAGAQSLKAAALKEICAALGLDASGKRADLLERVRALLPDDE